MWTSSVVKPNHIFCLWPAKALAPLSWVLALETQLHPSFLVEMSAVDTLGLASDSLGM